MEQFRFNLDQEQLYVLKAILEKELTQLDQSIEDENKRHRNLMDELTAKHSGTKKILHKLSYDFKNANDENLDIKSKNIRQKVLINKKVRQTNEYDLKTSWLDKFKFVLNQANKAKTLKESLNDIRTYEPIGSGMDATFRSVQSKLSGSLKSQVNNNRLRRVKSAETGEFIYGFNEWFNEDGILKEQYQ